MPGKWPQHAFPNLAAADYTITSPATTRYNCIAWAARDTLRWWWPDPMGVGYWPLGVKRSETCQAFVAAYGTQGFMLCSDGALEPGIEKIALFGTGPAGNETPTHAALQLDTGKWTSKLGNFEDIEHSPVEAVSGPKYGAVVYYLARRRST